jgi:hypothetical protein
MDMHICRYGWTGITPWTYWRSTHTLRPTQPSTNWTPNEYMLKQLQSHYRKITYFQLSLTI